MQLSAFAAARAKRKFAEVEKTIEAQKVNGDQDLDEAHEKLIESTQRAILPHNGVIQDNISRGSSDSSDFSDGLETEQHEEPEELLTKNDFFCTWKPTSTNCERIDSQTQRISLVADETLCLAGEYGLRVEAGSLSLYGATLEASSRTHTVLAPSTHDLPVLKCASSHATAVLSSSDTGMRDLGSLSPLFDKIWNLRGNNELFDDEMDHNSFKYVSRFCAFIISMLTFLSS